MRIALLGVSHPCTRDYLHTLLTFPDLEIAGFYAEDHQHGQKLTAEFDIPYQEDVDDLRLEPLDAVLVWATPEQNPRLVKQAVQLARYIFCELPIAPALSDAEQLVGYCRSQGVTLYPALALRTLPVFQSLKQMIGQNDLGRVLGLKLEYQTRKLAQPNDDETATGQPLLLQNIIQAVDLVRWLLDTDVVESAAETGIGLLHSGESVVDVAMLSMLLANQTYATLDLSLALPATYPVPEKLEIELVGTGGWAHIDAYRQKIDTYTDTVMGANWGSDPRIELLRDFLNMVRQGDTSLTWADDALRTQAIALSAYETRHSTV